MPENEMKKVYGIDLGTTYSAISYINEYGKPEIITNSDNERVTPSVVYFESLENVIVGKIAKESAKADPGRVVDFVKLQMNNKDWTFDLDEKSFRPEEISAYILKRLVNDAEKTGNHSIKDVVITCPAYFGDLERSRTRQAGEIAGLNVIEILDEPVAAAINYGLNEDSKGKNIIVYDLGGGTFDVTVVSIGDDADKNDIKIVCTEGDHQLGGKNWDDAIFSYYIDQFMEQTGSTADPSEDVETAYDLRMAAETDKKTITNREKTTRKISHEGETARIELTREKFDELTASLLERTIELTNQVLEEAEKRGVTKIDTFLLVGGSTRMPQIAKKVEEVLSGRLGVKPVSFDVDEAVAKGAAQVGNIKSIQDYAAESGKTTAEIAEETGTSEEHIELAVKTSIQKVATKSYGIKALKNDNEIIFNLIKKQENVPAEGSHTFATAEANATEIDLIVFANNESDQIAEMTMGEEIGRAVFSLPQNLPKNAPIEITFKLNDEGTLSMAAVDKTYNQKVDAVFEAEGIMSAEELEAAQANARNITVE